MVAMDLFTRIHSCCMENKKSLQNQPVLSHSLSCLVLSCLVWSGLVLSGLVLSSLAVSFHFVLFCFLLSIWLILFAIKSLLDKS